MPRWLDGPIPLFDFSRSVSYAEFLGKNNCGGNARGRLEF
jgi:hypothetical protein